MYIETYVKVTPAKAKAWMQATADVGFINRSLRQQHVRDLAQSMADGRWDPHNGETIKIRKDGACGDGQHRLLGVIKYGRAVLMSVAYDVPDSSFKTTDIGVSRTVAQLLRTAGIVKYTGMTGSVARMFQAYKQRTNPGLGVIVRGSGVTKDLGMDLGVADELIQQIVSEVSRTFKQCLPQHSIIALAWRIGCNIHQENVFLFYQALSDGIGLRPGDPVYVLRERLLAMKATGRHGNGTRPREEVLYLCLKAFKHYLDGDTIKRQHLSVPSGRLDLPKFRTR